MRVVFLFMIVSSLWITTRGQTATNFSVKDCSGQLYTLFEELNAGKVVVLTWTMPCGSCVLPLKTTYNVVQSFQDTHPGMVQMLMADDYANTPCSSIDLWATSNGMPNTRRFSNAAINMLDYGSTGMPKVVVIGGPDKLVFYNANDAVNHVALQNAIQSAISVITSTLAPNNISKLSVSFQPSNSTLTIRGYPHTSKPVQIDVYDLSGIKIYTEVNFSENQYFDIKMPMLKPAIYFAHITNGAYTSTHKFVVDR